MPFPAATGERIVRNRLARLLPPTFLWAACGLLAAGLIVPHDPAHIVTALTLCILGPICGLIGLIVELDIRSQLHLARTGLVAEATVTEVCIRRNRNDNDYGWMRYCFATPDHRPIEKKVRLTYYEPAYIVPGSRVMVIYNPDKPRQNKPIERLWAVERDDS